MDDFEVLDENDKEALVECLHCQTIFKYFKSESIYVECPHCDACEVFI